jgi:hypothetical protein
MELPQVRVQSLNLLFCYLTVRHHDSEKLLMNVQFHSHDKTDMESYGGERVNTQILNSLPPKLHVCCGNSDELWNYTLFEEFSRHKAPRPLSSTF